MKKGHGLPIDGAIVFSDGKIIRNACPGPWHEAVALMYERGVSMETVAQNFKATHYRVRQTVRWVRESDRRIRGLPEQTGVVDEIL